MAVSKQYYSISFPFTSKNVNKYYFDLNETLEQGVRSQMMHVLFTPKGSKLRDPEFGTNLLHYMFDPSSQETWSSVKSEISGSVSKYIPNMKINDIQIYQDDSEFSKIFVRIDYSVNNNGDVTSDSVVTQI